MHYYISTSNIDKFALRSIYASKYQIRAMFDLKTKKKKKNKIRFKIYLQLIKIYNLEI